MAAHADDLAAVCAALHAVPDLVVAHSMGAFVSVVFARRHPDLVARLSSSTGDCRWRRRRTDAGRARRGDPRPTAARLSRRFADVDDYLAFWRAHPAFADDWSPALEHYLAYDLEREARRLVPTGDELRDDRRGHRRHEHA
jgi:pimeloyl-ACP methyl ester carboxylesterase